MTIDSINFVASLSQPGSKPIGTAKQLLMHYWSTKNPGESWGLTDGQTQELNDLGLLGNYVNSNLDLRNFKSYEELKTTLLYNKVYGAQLLAAKETDHLAGYFYEGHEFRERGSDALDNAAWNIRKTQALILNKMYDNPNDAAVLTLGDIRGNLMLDLNGNDRVDTGAEFLKIHELLAMDSNRDGLISANDSEFKNLKVAINDAQGGYQVVALSTLANFVNLEDYVSSSKTPIYDIIPGATDTPKDMFLRYVDPVYTYDQFDNDELNEMLSTQITTDDGWVVRSNETESFFKNIAYFKQSADGDFYLQRAHSATNKDVVDDVGNQLANGVYYSGGINQSNLTREQILRFNTLYNRYQELLAENTDRIATLQTALKETDIGIDPASVAGFKTQEMAYLEKEFERITQMDFSLKNMEKIKAKIEQGKAIESFSDLDIVIGLKQDGDGYRLRFNSGREVYVSSLYFNTGDFLGFEGNKRISTAFDQEIAKLDGNQDGLIDESEADYSTLAIKVDDKITLLKDAGVKMIHQKYFEAKDRLLLQLEFEDGTKQQAGGFYRVIDMSEQFKLGGAELKGLLGHPYRESSSVIKADVARV